MVHHVSRALRSSVFWLERSCATSSIMSSQTTLPTKRRRLDANSVPQQPQQNYERNVASGKSRNVYGNINHGPVSYAGTPAASSKTDDKQTAKDLLSKRSLLTRERIGLLQSARRMRRHVNGCSKEMNTRHGEIRTSGTFTMGSSGSKANLAPANQPL